MTSKLLKTNEGSESTFGDCVVAQAELGLLRVSKWDGWSILCREIRTPQ